MAHTPGPWFVADWADDFGGNFVTIEARSKEALEPGQTSIWPSGIVKHRVASTEDGENPIDDARLIAAAPELLLALQQLHDDVDEYQHINHLGGHDNHVLRVARAAIEKATGVLHPDVREKLQK